MLSYLQRIGKSLMIPVAVLPAAAILMGVGYWIDPTGWGGESQAAALLIKSGAALIDNMGILFAVGVAFGMSRDSHGAAALTGLVAFLIVTTLLDPGSVAILKAIPIEEVPAAFGKINNQFIGILSGVIAATVYNKTSRVELPTALAFFSGRRLSSIVTAGVMILVSLVLLFVWPVTYGGLVSFGEWMIDFGALGAGLYGFFNRLLIPVGLHHALNSVFWFDVAGVNDISNFWSSTGEKGVTGMYQAGFFPIMMFGLPAAALAMYHEALPSQKAKAAGILTAGAFASFFTGVTEPLEFLFMFTAPLLYFTHAFLTGLSLFISATFQWTAGFGFSAGLVDYILSFNIPIANKPYMLMVQGVGFAVVYYFVFRGLIKKFDLKTIGRTEIDEEQTAGEEVIGSDKHVVRAQQVINIVGVENIVSVDNCATRLRFEVKDTSIIDDARFVNAGFPGSIKPSKTSIQVIVGPDVEFVAEALKSLLK
ncbi:MAG: PTS transporter subunit EIIC [Spiroplasma sp.]|nr:PTS transporter subunit EIIC [Mycoplasmatales bacterium]